MKGKKWLVLVISLGVVLVSSGIGVTRSSFVDLESSSGNTFTAWTSEVWVQTSQGDFEAGVLNQVDTSSSPGDVKLDYISSPSTVTDTFADETKIASKTNLVVTGGQVKLTLAVAETLRPNADGDLTEFEDLIGAPTHWEAVDEEVADDATTHVGSDVGGRTDLFQLTASGLPTGTPINSVTVYERVREEGGMGDDDWQIVIKSGTTTTYSSQFEESSSWVYRSYQWTTDPNTGEAWTVAAVDALQAGAYVVTGVDVSQVYVEVDHGDCYNSSGTLTSTNLLSGETVGSIDSFSYNASSIPSGTSLKVQFSQDSTNWYNSAGTLGGWDTLSQGTNSIDLSGLGWSGANFYYQMEFTSDGNDTPVLDEICVNYYSYYSSGTVASQVLDTGIAGASWESLFWDETLPSDTDIAFEVRASDNLFAKDAEPDPPSVPDWTSVGGASPVISGLPSGRYMQWRATLTTSNPSENPVLHEVRVYHY